jgi:hypothetical protein
MLPIGSIVMTGVVWPSSGGFQPCPWAVLAASSRWVWQASAGLPLTRAADADRAVLAVLDLEDAVEDGAMPVEVDGEVLPGGGLARLGAVAADSQGVFGHG